MTIGIRVKFPGLSQAEFDEMSKHVRVGDPPQGMVFHASGPIEEGWGVIDFWESRENFDAFFPRVQEAMRSAGVELAQPPDAKEFPVYETWAQQQPALH
jgi:hypothetical protein